MESPLWQPSPERIARANLTAFRRRVRERTAPQVTDFASLYRWSVERPEQFWSAVWDFCEVRGTRPPGPVLIDGDRMPGARWFPGARLNFAENLLRRRDTGEALVFRNEAGARRALSFAEVYEQAAALAAALRDWGVAPGDRVAGYLPNIPETVIAMLAATWIGAVWTSCSPEFGLTAVLDRFGQTEPRVLFAASSYQYNGRRYDCLERVRGVARQVPSIERTVLVPYLDVPRAGAPPKAILWDEALAAARRPLAGFPDFPFNHPVYILYSSGTTGKPKCIVHGAGGTLLQHLKELVLHTDVKPDTRIVYFTTCGWMMWNWLVSALAGGATVILYDGSPFHPAPDALFRLAEEERVEVFGTSARYLAAVEKAGVAPARDGGLPALKTILSTGSPLLPESFDYVYRDVKQDVCLSSISGGTDIISCFGLGAPVLPVWRGEIQTRGLGMAVEIFDEDGRPVRGKKGELVCTRPFPSMPVGFWNDPDGERYRQAYFAFYPGVWRHGDWAELTVHDGLIIYGRSDAVLNPGGVRIGTAEIYRIVEQFPEVAESVVVGQEWDGDVRVVLFVKLRPGVELTDELRRAIRERIRSEASPRHAPAKILAVADIPRTVNNKISEIAVREAIHGREVKNKNALLNPESLELYRDLPELAR